MTSGTLKNFKAESELFSRCPCVWKSCCLSCIPWLRYSLFKNLTVCVVHLKTDLTMKLLVYFFQNNLKLFWGFLIAKRFPYWQREKFSLHLRRIFLMLTLWHHLVITWLLQKCSEKYFEVKRCIVFLFFRREASSPLKGFLVTEINLQNKPCFATTKFCLDLWTVQKESIDILSSVGSFLTFIPKLGNDSLALMKLTVLFQVKINVLL